ncbi:hypothetical protein VTL71DRAFT_13062 [Oculimacula yallundae]|uniref:BTB domain-containing protein n=1 Tax=Oculimacula yallundae TaxID=86028 RepID=A0ABR4CP93_9HELO
MPASFEEILNSRIFKFTVGQNVDGNSATFPVHEEAIAALSKPLQALVRSGLSESETGHATWDNVSKETFVRFAQFAYTGDYSVPKLMPREVVALHDKDPNVEDTPFEEDMPLEKVAEEMTPYDHQFHAFGSRNWKRDRKGRRYEATHEDPEPDLTLSKFQRALIEPHSLHNYAADAFDPPKSFEHNKIYSSAFVGHASLWVLGDYQLVESLKALALYKLHKTLSIFQLSKENISDVVDLARYAYSDEGAGSKEGISELRNLVCLFLAVHRKVLCNDDGFLNLMAEGGPLVKDFFKYSTT